MTLDRAIKKWSDRRPARFDRHESLCCSIAIEWIRSMDQSMRRVEPFNGPTWIRARYDWGPQPWPIYWCEAVLRSSLDCGGLAILASYALGSTGREVIPIQLIQRFETQDTAHWRAAFTEKDGDTSWLTETYVYHEACAVFLRSGEMAVWDPTDCAWLIPDSPQGYSSTVAIRIVTDGQVELIDWAGFNMEPRRWVELG